MTLLNENIKNARIAAGLTQVELADKIGVKQQTIQKYENGIVSNIPSDKIESIAKALDVTPAYLMGWEFEQLLNNKNIWADESDRQFIMEMKDCFNLPVGKQSHKYQTIINTLDILNNEGIRKVENYAADIADSGKYNK